MRRLTAAAVDLERLFNPHIAGARAGDLDLARWRGTGSPLGPIGTMALRRGLLQTLRFCKDQKSAAMKLLGARHGEEHFQPASREAE